MHPLIGALLGPYVPVRVTRGTLVAHWCILMPRLAAKPRSNAGLLLPLSVSLLNDPADPVFDGVGLADIKSRAKAFLLA